SKCPPHAPAAYTSPLGLLRRASALSNRRSDWLYTLHTKSHVPQTGETWSTPYELLVERSQTIIESPPTILHAMGSQAHFGAGHLHFIIYNCYQRDPWLGCRGSWAARSVV